MADLKGDITNTIFIRANSAFEGEVSISGKALKLLSLLDGHTSIGVISRKMSMGLSDMRPLLSKLLEYGLIGEVREKIEMLEPEFLGYTAAQLSRITGPIAQVMVEDAVLEISGGSYELPKSQASELIDMLGRQIPDEDQRREFIKSMLKKLGEI